MAENMNLTALERVNIAILCSAIIDVSELLKRR